VGTETAEGAASSHASGSSVNCDIGIGGIDRQVGPSFGIRGLSLMRLC
jgi:hypothetical protein